MLHWILLYYDNRNILKILKYLNFKHNYAFEIKIHTLIFHKLEKNRNAS